MPKERFRPFFYDSETYASIIFDVFNIDEVNCSLVSKDVLKDDGRGHPPQHRDLIQLIELLKQNGATKTLNLADWGTELEKFEREEENGLNEEFPNCYGQMPKPPQWPPITWGALSLRW